MRPLPPPGAPSSPPLPGPARQQGEGYSPGVMAGGMQTEKGRVATGNTAASFSVSFKPEAAVSLRVLQQLDCAGYRLCDQGT